jgi:hypothetical protein
VFETGTMTTDELFIMLWILWDNEDLEIDLFVTEMLETGRCSIFWDHTTEWVYRIPDH